MSREEFWDLTLRELVREFVAVKRLRQREHDRDVTLAWQIAALTRGTKGLPKLETLLCAEKRPQTVSEQRQALQMIFGERKKQQLQTVRTRRG